MPPYSGLVSLNGSMVANGGGQNKSLRYYDDSDGMAVWYVAQSVATSSSGGRVVVDDANTRAQVCDGWLVGREQRGVKERRG
jgi:hypothetical protein